MKVTVTMLRRNGMRLKKAELDPPVTADLHMYDWNDGNSFRRAIRVLELRRRVGSIDQPFAKLVDPDLVTVNGASFVFRGVEIEARDGRVFEHEQLWRVTPAELPPSDPLPDDE